MSSETPKSDPPEYLELSSFIVKEGAKVAILTIKRFPLEEISFSSSNLFIVRLMAFGFRVIIKQHAI